ncbi:MAG: FGGY-family carbohydrate kinase [Gammaproteobacteria bacterium]|jgi:sugar (pentulose or hexulose) kinase|nr:FGGY-family carbohydrate kinase [Gammaproteobacteria bacterium]MBT3723118.1 FGGY-family carbohydrate kinase [Gammaproteobacteria bacterium]MBT4192713.1 FGGY-family carbohydrate kinase [Gammaproteobacteria bacterium]MBT4451722.1 FGGY-family carbohydrate kinase [Gammaproteobacteria bacterium]MBT4859930.1 FGGY-family carbohydrate kinase [Gammaproteobacteria bacterium]
MYLGIDFGTSGCRATVINDQKEIIAEVKQPLAPPDHQCGMIQQNASIWLQGLDDLFQQLSTKHDLKQIKRLAIDGTSGTVIICNSQGKPLLPALMYNDSSSFSASQVIKQQCPSSQHITMSLSAGLPKAIQLCEDFPDLDNIKILNQADFLSNRLCGKWGFSDYHNALKLGFDVQNMQWPEWIGKILPEHVLPEVLHPGEVIGQITTEFSLKYSLSEDCLICAGSTDANAAFIATESTQLGDAVTSIGTTLVLKILNDKPVEELSSGVYSHKLGNSWLVGGGSNAGAGILRQFFTDQQITDLSNEIDLNQPTGLNYYPLSRPGERFPYNDPHKEPVLQPRPDSDVEFLQALLEGLSQIEKTGYEKFHQIGALKPGHIKTCGGGAQNPKWTEMRHQLLNIPVKAASQTEASYGSALLALHGLKSYQ